MQGESGADRELLDAAALCGHLVPKGSVHALLAVHRHDAGDPDPSVRRLIPELVDRVWVREHNLTPGRPVCDWEDPADMERLVSELVDDANELVWAAEDLELDGCLPLDDPSGAFERLIAAVHAS